ncbi:metal-dependent hydrolase [Rossellomorea sp. BNER]|uniref:metal-dependent hydrolase n=1 Tax=Rossellomorea sp. BNER TaxID=2962031 RepID=UPI003AF21885|nr:metal-dependent hydrolase [Rossellomorea sp. BNER]
MNGTAHMAIGATTGFIVANTLQTDPITTLSLVGFGGVSGLIPDLDVNGKLRNKFTASHKFFRTLAQIIGVLMMVYSYLKGVGQEQWLGIGAGIGILIIASFITKRHMLTVAGIGVLAGGLSLGETWVWLFGIYIIIASLVSHRSYTHSIIGLLYFGVIAYYFQEALGVAGIFITCLLGYASHLLADMKLLPFNKRGVKFFLPLSSKEL